MSRQEELDQHLEAVQRIARLLPALSVDEAERERVRLARALARGDHPVPRWEHCPRRVKPEVWRSLDRARSLVLGTPLEPLYLPRFDELELELAMLGCLGHGKRIRPLALRRFGNGRRPIRLAGRSLPVREVADAILRCVDPDPEPLTVPAAGRGGERSLSDIVDGLALSCQLEVRVKVDARLVARAAAGERTVFLSDGHFGEREARRLAVHEVLGHMVAAANARLQPLGIVRHGTAGAFEDQEGVAVFLEEASGYLDAGRLRTLAARVVATDGMHDGAHFGDVARELHRRHGFSVVESVAIAERAFRGGGVARDVAYLRGWLRVRSSIAASETTVDELRLGKVSLDALPDLRELAQRGWVRPPVYRPILERSLAATGLGTSLETSPPSFVTSLHRPEAT